MEIEDEDSFKGELDLAKKEEEEIEIDKKKLNLTLKERLKKIMDGVNSPKEFLEKIDSKNGIIKLRGGKKPTEVDDEKGKKIEKPLIPVPYDPNFDLDANYFYQTIKANEWDEISEFLEKFITSNSKNEKELEAFFNEHPKIIKGNVPKLQKKLDEIISSNKTEIDSYIIIMNFFLKEYYKPKPSICECYFFPEPANEQRVVNMIRTCKKTLDVAIFTFTRDSLAQAVLEAFQRGLKVRCIADDECAKMSGSDIRLLASIGIPMKTDKSVKYHMHHKFAILDNSVVVTGSFNWTNQAIKYNQENIFFYEDKEIAQKYTDAFEHLWKTFDTVVDQEEAKKYIEEQESIKKEKKEKKEKEKAEKQKQKEIEKAKKKKEKEKIKEAKEKEKEKEKKMKEKEKEKVKKEKEKEKVKKEKEKEKAKKEKEKVKAKAAKEKGKSKVTKLKERIKSIKENSKSKNVKKKVKRVRGVKK